MKKAVYYKSVLKSSLVGITMFIYNEDDNFDSQTLVYCNSDMF